MPDGHARQLPAQTRLASFVPETYNADRSTIDVVWTTGATVARMDWWSGRRYDETLSLDPGAVRLDRMNSGAPVLDTHGQWQLADVIGVVEPGSVRIADGKGTATVRFSSRADVAPIVADVRAGIIRNISVGYIVHRYKVTRAADDAPESRDLWTAVDWEPTEISFVPVGADAGAGTRAREADSFPCVIEGARAQKEHQTMSAPAQTPGGNTAPVADPAVPAENRTNPSPAPAAETPDVNAAVQAAIAAERTRSQAIRSRVRAAGLDDDVADDLIGRGIAAEHAGNHILDALAQRSGAGTVPHVTGTGRPSGDDPAVIRERLVDAWVARGTQHLPLARDGAPAGTGRQAAPDAARQYLGLGLLQGLAEYARSNGQRIANNLDRADLYDALVNCRALSTSDFPLLLASAANKMLMAAYQLAMPSYRMIGARRSFNDFKAHSFLKVGDFPVLLAKDEQGEYTYGSISESSATVSLIEYGRIVPIGRRVLINDDLNALGDLVGAIARRVPDLENSLVWTLLQSASRAGPNLTEPVSGTPTTAALFSSGWATLDGSAEAITIGSVGRGRSAMMKKTSLDGLKLNITPRYLVTGPDIYTVAEQFVSQNLAAAQFSNINPFAGKLEAVGEANITDTNDWYLFADPAVAPVVIYGNLGSQQGPRIESRTGFTTDGVDVKAALDFGTGVIDYRGAWRNPGA